MAVLYLLVAYTLITEGQAFMSLMNEKPVLEEAHIKVHFQNRDSLSRAKRDLDHMRTPLTLAAMFTWNGKDVYLYLSKTDISSINMIMGESGVAGRRKLISTPTYNHTSLYHDNTHHATIMVEWNPDQGTFQMTGSFLHGDGIWNIEPSTNNLENSPLHLIQKVHALPNTTEKTQDQTSLYPSKAKVPTLEKMVHHRSRRDLPVGGHIIELAWFSDCYVWKKFLKYAGDDEIVAKEFLHKYFVYMSAATDNRFASIGEQSTYRFRVFGAFIHVDKVCGMNHWSRDNKVNDGVDIDAKSALNDCGDYQYKIKHIWGKHVPQWDFVICVTKKTLVKKINDEWKPSPVNVFKNSFCNDPKSSRTGLVQLFGNTGLDLRAAHALGRGLGASIDDSDICKSEDLYIMSSFVDTPGPAALCTNRWRFSSCSVSGMMNYLNGENPSGNTKWKCLEQYVRANDTDWDNQENQPLPGLELSLNEQCEFRFGNGSQACDPYDKVNFCYEFPTDICCNGIWCTDPKTYICSNRLYRVQDGSPCGKFSDQVCRSGKCVSFWPDEIGN